MCCLAQLASEGSSRPLDHTCISSLQDVAISFLMLRMENCYHESSSCEGNRIKKLFHTNAASSRLNMHEALKSARSSLSSLLVAATDPA